MSRTAFRGRGASFPLGPAAAHLDGVNLGARQFAWDRRLAVVGLTAYEIEHDYTVSLAQREDTSSEREPWLATAA